MVDTPARLMNVSVALKPQCTMLLSEVNLSPLEHHVTVVGQDSRRNPASTQHCCTKHSKTSLFMYFICENNAWKTCYCHGYQSLEILPHLPGQWEHHTNMSLPSQNLKRQAETHQLFKTAHAFGFWTGVLCITFTTWPRGVFMTQQRTQLSL